MEDARRALADLLPRTPLVEARSVTASDGAPVFLKLETELPTGSFKVRGALYALRERHARSPVEEVVASSTGNHGAAVAYAADTLGIPATIFLPDNPNPTKVERIRALGGTVVEGGRDLSEAYQAAAAYAGERGAYLLNDASDPVLPAGPGTIALEILEQAPQVVRMVVPVGDTALIRGMAAPTKARRTDIRIVGVQAEQAPAYALSWRSGKAVPTETCDTIADGLATRTPLEANVEAIGELVDDFVLVSEEAILEAVAHLMTEEDVVAEPAGAAALAGFRELGAVEGATALVVSGGNLDPAIRDRLRASGHDV